MRRRRFSGWVNRHAGMLLLVTIAVFGSLTVWQAGEQNRGFVRVLRAACEDRNVKDAKLSAAVEGVAAKVEADPADIVPLREALAPRDCAVLYPMPH